MEGAPALCEKKKRVPKDPEAADKLRNKEVGKRFFVE